MLGLFQASRDASWALEDEGLRSFKAAATQHQEALRACARCAELQNHLITQSQSRIRCYNAALDGNG